MSRITRRTFAATAAAGLATTALSADRVFGANDRVRLGFVGLGNRGDQVLDAFLSHKDAEVAAICDIDPFMLEKALGRIAKAGKPKPKVYSGSGEAWREMYAKAGLDAVFIVTPWELHAVQAIEALRARIAVGCEVVAGVTLEQFTQDDHPQTLWLWVLAAIPAFASGLAEDITKRVSARRRLFFTAVSTLLGIWLLNATITRTGIPLLDELVAWAPLAVLFTMFMVTGVTHAVNIIDGFNGLASMCVLMMMLALAYVAYQVGDRFVLTSSLICAGAILGFFFWNFPAGLIFLGDGGAYFLGFTLAELSVLLIARTRAGWPTARRRIDDRIGPAWAPLMRVVPSALQALTVNSMKSPFV